MTNLRLCTEPANVESVPAYEKVRPARAQLRRGTSKRLRSSVCGKPAMRRASTISGLVAVAAMACAFSTEAFAEPAFCADLRDQYRIAVKSGANGNPTNLRQQLAQAQSAARQSNCNRLFLFLSPRNPACPQINAAIGRLQRQLAVSGGGTGWGNTEATNFGRARLRAALTENGCTLPTESGSGRTLCVRVCDGYYFPISNKVSGKRTKIDAVACQSMYSEDGQADLYVQRSGNSDVGEAVSLNGKRYADQPFAFQFRETYNPACHAELKLGIAALAARYLQAQVERGLKSSAVTEVRADDSRTEPPAEPVYASEIAPQFRSAVRMVGDAYYSELYDLARPAPVSLNRKRFLSRSQGDISTVSATAN